MKDVGIICELGVKNVDVSIEFYKALGFEVVETVPADVGSAWAELSFQGSRLMLQETTELAAEVAGVVEVTGSPSHVIVLRVGPISVAEDMRGKLSTQATSPSRITYTDYGTAEFSVVDPDGYVLLIAGS
jgi:catechol 2,3-dioxygenase-like lactoylglutathione lyase family enzyme